MLARVNLGYFFLWRLDLAPAIVFCLSVPPIQLDKNSVFCYCCRSNRHEAVAQILFCNFMVNASKGYFRLLSFLKISFSFSKQLLLSAFPNQPKTSISVFAILLPVSPTTCTASFLVFNSCHLVLLNDELGYCPN